jgi:hypothetical protein
LDERKFDSFVRSLAPGQSRRSVLKAILGVGGGAALGHMRSGGRAEAARRPTPTPKPVKCPGSQTWNGSACACTAGTTCGAECCPVGVSECCDNACCYGKCMGEELCCATENYCPGATATDGLCCEGGQICCDGGTSGHACAESCAVVCDAGSEPSGEGGCVECGAGTASPDGLACLPCAEGTYAAGTGNAVCVACECNGCDPTTGTCQCVETDGECDANTVCCRGFCLGGSCYCDADNTGQVCNAADYCCGGQCTYFEALGYSVCGTCLPDLKNCSADDDCCTGVCTQFSGKKLCGTCLPMDFLCKDDDECCGDGVCTFKPEWGTSRCAVPA